jgi:translocator protein
MRSPVTIDAPGAGALRWSLFLVPVILGLGFLSGRVAGSGPGNPWFDALAKPAIYPPPATFGIVWSLLYIMMGVALALIVAERTVGARVQRRAVIAFVVQLALNLAWTPLFFAAHRITGALALIVVLAVAVAVTIALFRRIRPAAALLLLPYLAWVLFATLLTWEFLRLNPAADGGPSRPSAVARIELPAPARHLA